MGRPRTSESRKALTSGRAPAGGKVLPLARVPPAPSHLSVDAVAAWQRFGRDAVKIGTLTSTDLGVLELLARSWASCLELERMLSADGWVLVSGTARKGHPAGPQLAAARVLCLRILTELGLSAVGRQRVDVAPPGPRVSKAAADREKLAESFFSTPPPCGYLNDPKHEAEDDT